MGSGREPPHLAACPPSMPPRAWGALSLLPSPVALCVLFYRGYVVCPGTCLFGVGTAAPNQTLKDDDFLGLCGLGGHEKQLDDHRAPSAL